jgi:hypothetical protein
MDDVFRVSVLLALICSGVNAKNNGPNCPISNETGYYYDVSVVGLSFE